MESDKGESPDRTSAAGKFIETSHISTTINAATFSRCVSEEKKIEGIYPSILSTYNQRTCGIKIGGARETDTVLNSIALLLSIFAFYESIIIVGKR